MKKLIFAFIFMGLAVIMFYACKKDTAVNNNDETNGMSVNGKMIYNKLVNFNQKLKNTYKDGTVMTIDSTQWYVEAYYNVTSGYPDSAFHSFELDTATYTIQVDQNNMINISDISTLISDMENHLSVLISEYQPDDAHLVVGDISINHIPPSSSAEVSVTTGLGVGLMNMYTPFPPVEQWFYGMTAGRCDLIPPTPPYRDAGDELEERFNNPNFGFHPYNQCTNQTHIKIIATDDVWHTWFDNSMIYGEWFEGSEDYPCYFGDPYWNVYLNYGTTLFYNDELNGGLIPVGKHLFSYVDIKTFSIAATVGGIDGYNYYHGYQTFYSVYECILEIE